MYEELDRWWASLPIAHKERIAGKAQKKVFGTVDPSKVEYPACSVWWNSLTEDHKQRIHDHCVDRHGYLLPEWNEGTPYGD